jgi:hypothetical protein
MTQTDPKDFLRAASSLLELPIREQDFGEVLAAFEVMTAEARLLAAFALPATIDAAPRFIP